MDLRRLPTRAVQLWLLLLRQEIKLTGILMSRLERINQSSRASVVARCGPVVSITSHGDRLRTIHLVLESIAAGSVRPSRLILWLDSAEAFANPSPGLQRLVERGLEICMSDNFGPHTKYYPYILSSDRFESPLVTADDDILYSKWWLEGLSRSHREHPGVISCYRAHLMRFADRMITPYQTWASCRSSDPSFLHFATGVSGCIYPARFLEKLRLAGSAFLQHCPKADDVWLHVNAIRSGMKIRQIWNRPLRFPIIPGTEAMGLYHTNFLLARNDEQIRSTYTDEDVAMLERLQLPSGNVNI
jgi:hypothetical protein